MKVNYIGSVSADHFTESFLPLFEESVPVGFPSPANDYLEVAYTNIHTNFNVNLDKGYFSVHKLS